MMFWYDGNGVSGWGYALMAVSMVVFWGLVIAAIIALARYLGGTSERNAPAASVRPAPEQLLAETFARGDIDEAEYRRRLDVLRGDTRPVAS